MNTAATDEPPDRPPPPTALAPAGRVALRAAADRLSFAAAPACLAMAVLASLAVPGPAEVLCGGSFALDGMVPMYLLMALFHLPPWLRLLDRRV